MKSFDCIQRKESRYFVYKLNKQLILKTKIDNCHRMLSTSCEWSEMHNFADENYNTNFDKMPMQQ